MKLSDDPRCVTALNLVRLSYDRSRDTYEVPGFGRCSGQIMREGVIRWDEGRGQWSPREDFIRLGESARLYHVPTLLTGRFAIEFKA